MAAASRSPWSPVQALALPELMTTARIDSLGVRSRHSFTGAANTRFCVNTPAATAGASDTISDKIELVGIALDAAVDAGGSKALWELVCHGKCPLSVVRCPLL